MHVLYLGILMMGAASLHGYDLTISSITNKRDEAIVFHGRAIPEEGRATLPSFNTNATIPAGKTVYPNLRIALPTNTGGGAYAEALYRIADSTDKTIMHLDITCGIATGTIKLGTTTSNAQEYIRDLYKTPHLTNMIGREAEYTNRSLSVHLTIGTGDASKTSRAKVKLLKKISRPE